VKVKPCSSAKPPAMNVPAELWRAKYIVAPGPVQLVSHDAKGFVQVVAKHGSLRRPESYVHTR